MHNTITVMPQLVEGLADPELQEMLGATGVEDAPALFKVRGYLTVTIAKQ